MNTNDADPSIDCPRCRQALALQDGALQRCPHCAEQFYLEVEEEESDEDREAREAIEQRAAEEKERLDDRRIQVVQLEKRGLYRARSWALVVAMGCMGIAGQLVWLGVNWFRDLPAEVGPPAIRERASDPIRGVAYFVIAVGLAVVSIRFFRKARRYLLEAKAMSLPEPTTPPDFSTLSDGSQIVDELKRMSDEP